MTQLTLHQMMGPGMNAGDRALIKQKDGRFQQAVKLVLGESGNPGRLCAGMRVEVRKHWLRP